VQPGKHAAFSWRYDPKDAARHDYFSPKLYVRFDSDRSPNVRLVEKRLDKYPAPNKDDCNVGKGYTFRWTDHDQIFDLLEDD
jgi:hypothetical protein